MPIANTPSGEAVTTPLPFTPAPMTLLPRVDPDLEQAFCRNSSARLPFLVILVEPFPPTDPRAVDTTTRTYTDALAALAGPVMSALDELQLAEHLIGYKVLGSMAFFSACGDLESVRAISTLAQVEFIAYDGIPRPCSSGPE